jgi:hypothetical protein
MKTGMTMTTEQQDDTDDTGTTTETTVPQHPCSYPFLSKRWEGRFFFLFLISFTTPSLKHKVGRATLFSSNATLK